MDIVTVHNVSERGDSGAIGEPFVTVGQLHQVPLLPPQDSRTQIEGKRKVTSPRALPSPTECPARTRELGREENLVTERRGGGMGCVHSPGRCAFLFLSPGP